MGAITGVEQRAIDWGLYMQCRNGGWASFDKNNDRMDSKRSFADHNAMQIRRSSYHGAISEMLATLA